MVKTLSLLLVPTLFLLSGGAFAFDFWGISIGTEVYSGAPSLTFTAPGTGIAYQVGAYQYTKVGSTWFGPYPAASPGAAYPTLQRYADAMGLFFKPEDNAARFMIITGMPDTGITASEIGYGTRQFGPGDLKIDTGGATYGVGLRAGGLVWAVDPSSTAPWFQIYKASGVVDSMYARDAGTLGKIVRNPQWDRVDNHVLAPYDDRAYAFFVAGTGTDTGSTAIVNIANTGVTLNGVSIYAYEAIVPWTAIGLDPLNYDIRASWRPDCGNDIITLQARHCEETTVIPEPCSVILALVGLTTVAGIRRRK